jgi:hypothetical protein
MPSGRTLQHRNKLGGKPNQFTTMKTNFTPGPWAFREGSTPHFQGLVYSEETGTDICVTYHDEGGHNAALIAAAPDMLEALQKALEQIESGEGVEACRIIEAIQKATEPCAS